MTIMKTKKEYIAPELTVVSFKTERGYASSQYATFDILNSLLGNLTGSNMEVFQVDNTGTFEDANITWE